MRALLVPVIIALLPACTALRPASAVMHPQTGDWRAIATVHDRERLREWRSAFTAGLRAARASGRAADIAREGA
jgi:outer membrane biogenesis lipoprotein LolB